MSCKGYRKMNLQAFVSIACAVIATCTLPAPANAVDEHVGNVGSRANSSERWSPARIFRVDPTLEYIRADEPITSTFFPPMPDQPDLASEIAQPSGLFSKADNRPQELKRLGQRTQNTSHGGWVSPTNRGYIRGDGSLLIPCPSGDFGCNELFFTPGEGLSKHAPYRLLTPTEQASDSVTKFLRNETTGLNGFDARPRPQY